MVDSTVGDQVIHSPFENLVLNKHYLETAFIFYHLSEMERIRQRNRLASVNIDIMPLQVDVIQCRFYSI